MSGLRVLLIVTVSFVNELVENVLWTRDALVKFVWYGFVKVYWYQFTEKVTIEMSRKWRQIVGSDRSQSPPS